MRALFGQATPYLCIPHRGCCRSRPGGRHVSPGDRLGWKNSASRTCCKWPQFYHCAHMAGLLNGPCVPCVKLYVLVDSNGLHKCDALDLVANVVRERDPAPILQHRKECTCQENVGTHLEEGRRIGLTSLLILTHARKLSDFNTYPRDQTKGACSKHIRLGDIPSSAVAAVHPHRRAAVVNPCVCV